MRMFLITEDNLDACDSYQDWGDEFDLHYKTIENIRSNPYNSNITLVIDKLLTWLYEEGMKFEKKCDSEENYTEAASACARRAQCYYTIQKLNELVGDEE